MNYIKKAAGLTGWLAADGEGEYIQIPDQPFSLYLDEITDSEQWLIDALAAQLVRQVDAICQCEITAETVTIREVWKPRYGYAEGPDRTLNTIKAIVDSGVLDD